MDFFDILWLLICIGLPVISGIASAKKKNAGKGKSVPQNSEVPVESDLKEIFKSIIQEMNAQNADDDDDDEDEEDEDELEEVKPAQVQVNAAEPVPAPEAPAHPAPEVRPAQEGYHAAEPQPVPAYHPVSELRPTPEMRPASDLRASFTMRPVKSKAPVLQEDDKKQKEKINLRNLVIYSSIMEPKFKE